MEKNHCTENVPPAKNLKQATLNFFKISPKVEKSIETNKTKKRKNSSPVCAESPNKSAKLSKPLVVITDLPNSPSKQAKVSKASADRIINDHEVSSSSEADSGSSKTSNGKCCLMERFVCKLPKEGNQEISSTNDIDKKTKKARDSNDADKDTEGVDCIVIDEEDTNKVVKSDSETPRIEGASTFTPQDVKPTKSWLSSNESSVKTNECVIEQSKNAEDLMKNITSSESLQISSTPNKSEVNNPADLDTSLNLSVTESSFLSETSVASTPCKQTDSPASKENAGNTPSGSDSITLKTPGSKKKGPKVDLAKKAEKEAHKLKRKEERELQRSEKKRKLEEDKAEKERVRQEKKEAKEKEKQLQQEKLQKEKDEKERLKEIERQKKEEEKKKKEEERLLKEEEKKKKQAVVEAKMEEKRKREEERKRKEEEKQREEEEKKKQEQKVKQAFQSFFIKSKENVAKPAVAKSSQGQFVPFQVKKDMHLAPATRRDALSEDTKLTLDQVLENPNICLATYLEELKSGREKPHKTGRILRVNPKPSEDIEVVHDPEALKKVLHKVKLLQFYTDYRPPYYGTWSKTPKLSPRNPWKKDESLFDYEVDSDDEWEEEEPGESLSCSDGEEEKGEKGEEDENEDDEDGWMVPHGYLSEDEGCNEDDEITPEKLKLQQLAKAKAWEEEQKRKLQAAPLIAVGCFFEHCPSPLMAGDVRLLYEFRGVVISPVVPIPTSLFGCSEPEVEEPTTPDKTVTTPSQRGTLKKAVPDEAMPDLIRLVHGNTSGIKRLIREFRVFWLKKESADSSGDPTAPKEKLDKSVQENDGDVSIMDDSIHENPADSDGKQSEESEEKKTEDGLNCSISKRQLDIKINAIAVREKRQGFKTCWYVHDSVLKEFDIEGLVCNSLVQPEPVAPAEVSKEPTPAPVRDQRSIMDFALSKEECAKKEIPVLKKVESSQLKSQRKDQKSIMEFAMSKETLDKEEAGTPKAENGFPTSQSTLKDTKKVGGQLSIMDFAKTGGAKSSVIKQSCKPEVTPMETDDPDVIFVGSSSKEETPAKPADQVNPDVSLKTGTTSCDYEPSQPTNPPCSNNPPNPCSLSPTSKIDQENSKSINKSPEPKVLLKDCFVKLENVGSSETGVIRK